MIGVPTTFVIGAGASTAYGLPTGSELMTTARALKRDNPIVRPILEATGASIHEFEALVDTIRTHPSESLDAFLETRADEKLRSYGRALIAALLCQAHVLPMPRAIPEDRWMEQIFGQMSAGIRTPAEFLEKNSGVGFVTFNFDSNVEEEIERLIRRHYHSHPTSDIESAVAAFPVGHVHGHFPRLPIARSPFDTSVLPSADWIQRAASVIRVIHDDIDPKSRDEARQLISDSRVVCFLGFGYRTENLQTLDVRTIATDGRPRVWFGSACGLEDSDRARIQRAISSPITLGRKNLNSYRFLLKHDVMRETEDHPG